MNSRKLISYPRRGRCGLPSSGSFPAGFSIIELMMSLVLLGVITALALPSYREMVEKRQVTYGAEQLMAFVNAVQSESIKQNRTLTLSYTYTGADDWCAGAVLGANATVPPPACDCKQTNTAATDYCAIDSAPWIIDNTHAGNLDLVQSMTGDGAYSFDPVRGLMTDLNDSLVVTIRSDSQAYRLQLRVTNTGQVILCSEDGSHAVPGYPACPAPAV